MQLYIAIQLYIFIYIIDFAKSLPLFMKCEAANNPIHIVHPIDLAIWTTYLATEFQLTET